MIATPNPGSAIDPVGPQDVWRLFTHHDSEGAFNMGFDEALLESVIMGEPPAVRFYSWSPAALSLGVNQAAGEINTAELRRRGFDLVRRLTGGRAVLHQHELTYSIVARENDARVSGGVLESYRKISGALVEALRALGVPANLSPPDRAQQRRMPIERRYSELHAPEAVEHGAVCFDTASAYEISVGGRKLVGSAQARRSGAILQHGSVLLDVNWDNWASVFSYAGLSGLESARLRLPARMTSLSAELGGRARRSDVEGALLKAFERHLGISLEGPQIDSALIGRADQLARDKYSADTWTFKR